MDLLFSKYASPYLLLDEIISEYRLSEFVYQIAEKENEGKLWDMYLSLLSNPYSEVGSFTEFKQKHMPKRVDENINLGETINDSYKILQKFNPET